MPYVSKKRRRYQQALVKADAVNLQRQRDHQPDAQHPIGLELPPSTIRVTAGEEGGQGREDGAATAGEPGDQVARVSDGSEIMSGSEGSLAGSDESELDSDDGIQEDGWSEAESFSERDSDRNDSGNLRVLSLELPAETSWQIAESRLPGNSWQIRSQTPGMFTRCLVPLQPNQPY
jgi:hypothetical protein